MFEEIAGRSELVGLEIGPDRRGMGGPTPLTTTFLRSLPLARLVAEQEDWFRDQYVPRSARLQGLSKAQERAALSRWKAREGAPGRPPKFPLDHYKDVSEIYRRAFAVNRTPTLAVARAFGTTESAAAKWVAKCRALGLLPRTTQGKARVSDPRKGGRR